MHGASLAGNTITHLNSSYDCPLSLIILENGEDGYSKFAVVLAIAKKILLFDKELSNLNSYQKGVIFPKDTTYLHYRKSHGNPKITVKTLLTSSGNLHTVPVNFLNLLDQLFHAASLDSGLLCPLVPHLAKA